MPIRDRIIWGDGNPFSDSATRRARPLCQGPGRAGSLPGVTGGSVLPNVFSTCRRSRTGYYREYDVEPAVKGRTGASSACVLGNGSAEVHITGNHYRDFRQIINMPT